MLARKSNLATEEGQPVREASKLSSEPEEASETGGKTRTVKKPRRRARLAQERSAVNSADHESEATDLLPSTEFISPADAEGLESIKSASNREMLLFAQNETTLMRRQAAIFRKASAWIANVPESRREGVRQAVAVYVRNVRAWQSQTKEQEMAFLAARGRDQDARARFMLAEKSLLETTKPKRFRIPAWMSSRRRRQMAESIAQTAEQAAAVREALHDQGLAIHRYMRFRSEWENALEEMMAFVAEQMD